MNKNAHNNPLQPDQLMLSCLLLAQKPRQHSLAAEEGRYVSGGISVKNLNFSKFLMLCMMLPIVSCSVSTSTMTLSAKDMDDLRSSSANYVEAMQRSDWSAVAESFTADAIRMPPNAPTQRGRTEIENSFASISRVQEYEVTLEEIQGGAGIAYVHATYRIALFLEGIDTPISDNGKAIEIWKREPDGHWRMSAAIWNSDVPAMGN